MMRPLRTSLRASAAWTRFTAVLSTAVVSAMFGLRGYAEQTHGAPPRSAAASPATIDVALDSSGRLAGIVMDSQGGGVAGAEVVLERWTATGSSVAARLTTGDRGEFHSPPIPGGSYVASCGDTRSAMRVWKAAAAPPSARPAVLIVADPKVARAQSTTSRIYSFLEERPLLTYPAIAAAVVIPVVEIADDQDRKKGS